MSLKGRLYSTLGLEFLDYLGLSVREFLISLKRFPRYYRDVRAYRAQANDSEPEISSHHPVLTDLGQQAGAVTGHHFHEEIWAARKIRADGPDRHFDIGSRIDGFISNLLAFRDVTMIDIRPLDTAVAGLHFVQGDATELAVFRDDSIESLSTLHTAEHFGLGRYGDPIDPSGHTKFMSNLQRVLAPGGRLYLSVPVGTERVEFNAHRVLSPHTVLETFEELELQSLDGVIDGELVESVSPDRLGEEHWACGLFEFTK